MSRYAPPARLTFISHPATTAQKTGVFPADESLDSQSIDLLTNTTWSAPQGASAYTAPEHRTRETALQLGLDASSVAGLAECDFGRWKGLSLEALQATEPEALMLWLTDMTAAPHGGESFLDLVTRVGDWIECQREGGHVIAITHASVVRAAIVHVLHAPVQEAFPSIEIAPLSLTDIRLTAGRWRLRAAGVQLSGQDFL